MVFPPPFGPSSAQRSPARDREVDRPEDRPAADPDLGGGEPDRVGHRTARSYGDASSSRTVAVVVEDRNRSISRMNQRSCVTATTVPS